MEIVETGRRRRWAEDEKLKVVLESLQGPRLVSATARRHGISRSLLQTWRREFEASRLAASAPSFVPALVVPDPEPISARNARLAPPSPSPSSRMVIVQGRGRRVVVDAGMDAEALARVLDVLERR